MQVVLNEDVKGLGYKGEIIEVKPGYFRNYLAPKGLADAGTPSRLRVAGSRKDKLVMKKQQVLDNAKEVLAKLEGLSVTIKSKVSDKGKLYAAVSEADVIAAVTAESKVELEKDMLKMEHFKEVGEYDVVVHMGADLEETIKVVVEAE